MKLKNKDFTPVKLYKPDMDVSELKINNIEYQFLNKLKKANKPAFYYWYKCLSKIDKVD
ncbi:MAG: hypothetical protein ABFS35_20920 [Bacteroidota bacterium]